MQVLLPSFVGSALWPCLNPQNPVGKQKQAGPCPGCLLFLPSLHPSRAQPPHAAFPPR